MAKQVDAVTEIVINRSVEVVADYVTNPETAPEWYDNIKAAEWVTQPPLSSGSNIKFKARFMGRELVYTYEVVEWKPGEKMVMQTAQGPFPMKTVYAWEPVGEGQTHMTLRNFGQPAGFSRLLAPLMVKAMRRANNKDLRKLKGILESRDS